MAPAHAPYPARRALLWSTLPALAALFGLLWFRRRRRRAPPKPAGHSSSVQCAASSTVTAAPLSPLLARAAPASDSPPVDEDDRRCSIPPQPLPQAKESLVSAEPPAAAAAAAAEVAAVAASSPSRESAAEECRPSRAVQPERPVLACAAQPVEANLPPTPPQSPAAPSKVADSSPPSRGQEVPASQEGVALDLAAQGDAEPIGQLTVSSSVEVFSETTAEVCRPELQTKEEGNCSRRESDRLIITNTEVSERVDRLDKDPSEIYCARESREVYSNQAFQKNHSLLQESEEVINREVIQEEECAKSVVRELGILCEQQEVLKSVLDCSSDILEPVVSSSSVEKQRLLSTQSVEIVDKEGEVAQSEENHSAFLDLSKDFTEESPLTLQLPESGDSRRHQKEAINTTVVEEKTNKPQGSEKVRQETRLSDIEIGLVQVEPKADLIVSLGVTSSDKQELQEVSLSEQEKLDDSNQGKVVNNTGVESVTNFADAKQSDSVDITSSNRTENLHINNAELVIAESAIIVQEYNYSVGESKEAIVFKEDSEAARTVEQNSKAARTDRDNSDEVSCKESTLEVELNLIPNNTSADLEGLKCFEEDIKHLKNSALKERNTEAKEVTSSIELTKVKKSTEAEKENSGSHKSEKTTVVLEGVPEASKEVPSMKTREDTKKSAVRSNIVSNSALIGDTTPVEDCSGEISSPKSPKKSKNSSESSQKSPGPESSKISQKSESSKKVISSIGHKITNPVQETSKESSSSQNSMEVSISTGEPTKIVHSTEEANKVNSMEVTNSKEVNTIDDSITVGNSIEEPKKVVSPPESNKKAKKSKKSRNSPQKNREITTSTTTILDTPTKSEKERSSSSVEQKVLISTNFTAGAKGASETIVEKQTSVIRDEATEEFPTSKESQNEMQSSPAAKSQNSPEVKKTASGARSKSKESSEQIAKTEEVAVTRSAPAAHEESPDKLTKAEADELARLIQRQLSGTKCFDEGETSEPSDTKSEAGTQPAPAMEALHVDAVGLEAGADAPSSPSSGVDLKGENSSDSTADSTADSTTARNHHHHHHQQQQQRDSANHSPAEGMLASPRACFSEDAASENSSDSGKGCSDAATPPSRTPASGSSVSGDGTAPTASGDAEGETAPADVATAAAAAAAAATAVSTCRVYEFVIPQHLVGRLIGRHGCFVHQIKARTNASILIKRHPDSMRLKICAVEGTPTDVENALDMIRQKFPEKRYPNLSLEQVCFVAPPMPVVPVLPDCLRLHLVEGVTNDVTVSSLVTPAHFFLQQPTHPTFPALARLGACMDATYSEETPAVPSVNAGIIVAAPVMGSWFRAEVVTVDPETETCQVRYVDYGGYEVQSNSALRQIRSDFMTLPFQAAECYLANIVCKNEEEGWTTDAVSLMEQMTACQVLQAQVCGYCEDGTPAVSLYAVVGSQVVSISEELVARGFAQWWEPVDG